MGSWADRSLLDLAPATLEEYLAAGGGAGLERARSLTPQQVIDQVAASGLRGRGGAGFPTGEKWRSIRSVGTGVRYAVCNAAEGEPGTYKDRLLLERNPYQVLEGLAIQAYAVGARNAFIVTKETFTRPIARLASAIDEMTAAGVFGDLAVALVLGPDLYLLGEETGLLECVERKIPLPRTTRPFMQGLFADPNNDNPTAVNNVETLSNVPPIMAEGPGWLRAFGTERSPGTMLFTICGDVVAEGVYELPLGTTLRYLIEDVAGGCPEGRAVKVVFPGASSTVIPGEALDTPMDFESMRAIGTGLGAGSFVVFDESACIVRATFLYSRFLAIESCGQCPACKLGSGIVTDSLARLDAGGTVDEIETILARAKNVTDGQRCALPTGETLLVQSLYHTFEDEFWAHVGRGCPLPRDLAFPKIVDYDEAAGRFVYDEHYSMRLVSWTYSDRPPAWPGGYPTVVGPVAPARATEAAEAARAAESPA